MIVLPAISTIASRDAFAAGGNNTWTDLNYSTAWFSGNNWQGSGGPPGVNNNNSSSGNGSSVAVIPVGFNYASLINPSNHSNTGSLTIQLNSGGSTNDFGSSGYSLGELSFTDSSTQQRHQRFGNYLEWRLQHEWQLKQ